ncbi:Actin-binding, cofilin/tropomyosin type [Cynara cardunculus var. scolymus]|uniref:Actin-binding, cofilin/tropomyosin type n=1 Tax=Cynara cardunculus var. scolymus TaxID=59895 RepID=A0A118K7K7_CYNCS|nr:Actin-binding, cofilin/tropomyosin type [Cynara cardunculus var. scolymus]
MSFRFRGSPNASSGMGVAEHCKGTFLELQRKKAHRYVIFKIDEKKNEVVVERTGSPAESYQDLTSALPDNDCRYAVYDFDFVTSENCQKSKIFFIAWLVFPIPKICAQFNSLNRSPASSRIRAKMLYATSKSRIIHELDGVHYEIQATDFTEMDLEVLRERVY